MKSEKLLSAFGQIDDDLISNAVKIRAKIIPFPRKIRKWAALAACVAILISAGLIQFNGDSTNQFAVNLIVDETYMDNMIYFDPELHYEEEWTDEQFANYFERDYTTLSISKTLEYISQGRGIVILKNDGTVVSDTHTFTYGGDSDNIDSRIMININKFEGLYDARYEYDNKKTSRINETELMIGGRLSDEKNGLYDFLVTDFYFNEIYFRVTATNIKLALFEKTLELLLQ